MCHAEIELGAVVENGMTVHSLLPCLADGDMTTTGRTLTISGAINPRKSHLKYMALFWIIEFMQRHIVKNAVDEKHPARLANRFAGRLFRPEG